MSECMMFPSSLLLPGLVGTAVGVRVGASVGTKVGAAVGITDGIAVGT